MEPCDKKFKREWTWEEWRASRAATRAISEKISPAPCCRLESSSDKRLRAAFGGARHPSPATLEINHEPHEPHEAEGLRMMGRL